MNRNDKGVTEAEVIKSGGKNAQKKNIQKMSISDKIISCTY